MTKARITLTLLLVLLAASLFFVVQTSISEGGFGTVNASSLASPLLIGGLLVLHLRGWRYSSSALVICLGLLIVLSANATYLRDQVVLQALVPAVIGSMLLSFRWTMPIFGAVMLGLALQVVIGGGPLTAEAFGPTFSIVNLVNLTIIAIGISLAGRLSHDAQRTAERNEQQTGAARRQLEVQAQALEREVAVAQAARSDAEAARAAMSEQLATIQIQREVIQEMSVPVLPITPTALLMPLIGALDSARLQLVQEHALKNLEQRSARYLLLDISGVPIVDTQVAGGLLRLVQAVGLLGAQVVLVGIRPEVAQSIVGLGIAFTNITTRSTLQDGISYVLKGKGVQVG